MTDTGANAPVSGEAVSEQWNSRQIQPAIKDRSVINGSAEVSAKEFTKVAATLRDVSQIVPGEGPPVGLSGTHDAPPMKLHISEISSHFPAILMESIFTPGFQSSGEKLTLNPEQVSTAEKTQLLTQRQPERMRILRFELEPAELGQVLVKMRVRETRVEIAIEAQAVSTTDLLSKSRDALSAAIEHNGLKLHAFDVATQADPAQTKLSAGGELGGSREGTSGRDVRATTAGSSVMRGHGRNGKSLNDSRGKKVFLVALMTYLLGFCSEAVGSSNICEAEMIRAARENDIPLPVLYAVALTETGQRGELKAYAMNIHGRPVFNATLDDALFTFQSARREGEKLIDVGCMQINHYYHGRNFVDVREMFEPKKTLIMPRVFSRRCTGRRGDGQKRSPAIMRGREIPQPNGVMCARSFAICCKVVLVRGRPSLRLSAVDKAHQVQIRPGGYLKAGLVLIMSVMK